MVLIHHMISNEFMFQGLWSIGTSGMLRALEIIDGSLDHHSGTSHTSIFWLVLKWCYLVEKVPYIIIRYNALHTIDLTIRLIQHGLPCGYWLFIFVGRPLCIGIQGLWVSVCHYCLSLQVVPTIATDVLMVFSKMLLLMTQPTASCCSGRCTTKLSESNLTKVVSWAMLVSPRSRKNCWFHQIVSVSSNRTSLQGMSILVLWTTSK